MISNLVASSLLDIHICARLNCIFRLVSICLTESTEESDTVVERCLSNTVKISDNVDLVCEYLLSEIVVQIHLIHI